MAEPPDQRDRIARGLHEVADRLVATSARLDALMLRTGDAAIQREVGDSAAELAVVVSDIRAMIFELNRGDGDPDSFENRVRILALDAGQRLGCTPRVDIAGPCDDLSPDLAEDLATVAQEALANVVRHSYGGTIELSLTVADGAVTLVVADDGVGPNDEPNAGKGIADMRARAETRGGTLTIEPREPLGTTLTWTVAAPS